MTDRKLTAALAGAVGGAVTLLAVWAVVWTRAERGW